VVGANITKVAAILTEVIMDCFLYRSRAAPRSSDRSLGVVGWFSIHAFERWILIRVCWWWCRRGL
jgi:hypothetical protein